MMPAASWKKLRRLEKIASQRDKKWPFVTPSALGKGMEIQRFRKSVCLARILHFESVKKGHGYVHGKAKASCAETQDQGFDLVLQPSPEAAQGLPVAIEVKLLVRTAYR